MFETLKAQPADKILMLMQMYQDDPRETKIDLGVGVYKNAEGKTPVMRAIKAAEHRLWQEQETKSYVGLAGDPAFGDAMIAMILGDAVERSNVAAAATPGGTVIRVRSRYAAHAVAKTGRNTCRTAGKSSPGNTPAGTGLVADQA